MTYDVRDLTPGGHNLIASEIAVNSTFGGNPVVDCPECCSGWSSVFFSPSSLELIDGNTDTVAIDGINSCNGDPGVLTPDFSSWGSNNVNIAKVTKAQVQAVGPGSTTGWASGFVEVPGECACNLAPEEPQIPVTVFDVGVKAENGNYILVGSDSHVTAPNLFQVTNQAQNGPPQPAGGTCCAASSDPSDTVTQTEGPPNSLYEFRFETLQQSTTIGDRTLTFEYDLSDGEATSVQVNVTAHAFAYAANSNPPSMCQANGGKYGYSYTYVYTPYTEPDKQPISAGIAEGAPVTETVTPQSGGTACTGAVVPGNGSLNGSGEFQDLLQLCSNAPIPACDKKYTQVIQIAGYPKTQLGARTNTLEYTNTKLTYTSLGPTQ